MRFAIFFVYYALVALGTWATFAYADWKFWLIPLWLPAIIVTAVFWEFACRFKSKRG